MYLELQPDDTTTTPKHATASDVSVNANNSPCKIETSELHHDQQHDMQLSQNQAYVVTPDIPTETNESYSTSRLPSPTRPCVHQQQEKFTQNQAFVTYTNI